MDESLTKMQITELNKIADSINNVAIALLIQAEIQGAAADIDVPTCLLFDYYKKLLKEKSHP